MKAAIDRTGAALAAVLVLVAALVLLGLHTVDQLGEDIDELDRSRDLQLRVQDVSTILLDLETSQRDGPTMRQDTSPGPDRAGLARLDRALASLGALAPDRVDDGDAIRQLRGLVDARRADLARSIALADTQGIGAAPDPAQAGQGRPLTEDLRTQLGQLAAAAAAARAQRHAERAASITRNERLVGVLAAALGLLLGALWVVARRQRALQARLNAEGEAARAQLAQQVADRTTELQATAMRLTLGFDRLRGIFDAASEGILTVDGAQTIVEANPAAARMFGCEVRDLIGAPLERLIPERLRAAHHDQVEAFGAGTSRARAMHVTGNGTGREVTARRFDGEEFPIDASISCAVVAGQRLYTVIHRDLTEQRRADQALRDSRQLIAATFEASSVAMAQIDAQTRRFVAVNGAMCRLTGYTERDLLAMAPDDLNHPDDRIDAEMFDALLAGRSDYREQKRLIRRDGTLLWIEVAGSLVHDADGQVRRVIGVLQDITARRQAETALRGNAARQAFLVQLNDRLRELDAPRDVARQAARLLGGFVHAERVGYAQDDGDGETFTVVRHDLYDAHGMRGIEGRHRYRDFGAQLATTLRAGRTAVQADVAGDPSLSAEAKAAHAALQLGAMVNVPLLRDGHLQAVFFVHAARPRQWSADEVGLFEDVAQRVRAEMTRAGAQAAERAARATLQAALASMNDAVFVSDADGRIVEFNEAFVSFHHFGAGSECPRTMAEYRDVLEVLRVDGTPAPLAEWAAPRALRGEAASNVEYRLRRRDTGASWVGSYSFAPIRAADGRIVGAVVTARDVTQLQRAQEDLADSHTALQHLIANQQRVQEDERRRIARDLHDDLLQSLAAIRMDAVAIAQQIGDGRSPAASLLARIDRLSAAAIASTRRIVGDLRPQMLEELGLRPALEALCDEHGRRWGADCRFEVAGNDEALDLDDPVLSIGLFRIAQEALNNVAKHAKASAVTVHLDLTRADTAILRVADNGIGIPQRTRRQAASFGLLGVTERVRAMGGQLQIRPNGDRGTVIEVRVPILGPGADA